jgi:hypothetical protein
MVSADENTPIRGSGRNGKADKAEPQGKKTTKRNRKAAQAGPEPEQVREAEAQMEPPVASMPAEAPAESMPMEARVETVESPRLDAAPDTPSPAASAEAASVSLQTITDAYGEYTRRSIEQTGSFFEQLAGTRSLTRAFELQNEFARQTYETFVAESRKIRELHSEMTVQKLRSLEDFMARMKPTRSA